MHRGQVGRLSGRYPCRPVEEQRGADSAIVDMRLHAPHVADVSHRVGTVVVQVHHDRVVANSQAVEFPQQPPDVLVDVCDHRGNAGELVRFRLQPFRS